MTALTLAADQVGAFHLPTGSNDSALIASLDSGLYTVLVSGVDEGNALTEVYALPTTTPDQIPSRLVNLSARGKLTATNTMLSVGFVHVTDAARRILIRGVGPGLKQFVGDATVCANPRLQVFDANGTRIAQNNDWITFGADRIGGASQVNTVTDAATAARAFPLTYNSADAAVVLNLPGGQYTVQLDSEDGSRGEVLFEVYAVP